VTYDRLKQVIAEALRAEGAVVEAFGENKFTVIDPGDGTMYLVTLQVMTDK
jgi:hypothetical protein